MTFSYRCPHCQQQGRGDIKQARENGGRWNCDACGKAFRLKPPSASPSKETQSAATKPKSTAKPKRKLQAFGADEAIAPKQEADALKQTGPSATPSQSPAPSNPTHAEDSEIYELVQPPEPTPKPTRTRVDGDEEDEFEEDDEFETADASWSKGPQMENAALFSRVLAFIIDMIVYMILSAVFGFIFGSILGSIASPVFIRTTGRWIIFATSCIGALVTYIGYFTFTEPSDSSTIGKGIARIAVVDRYGDAITFQQAFIRSLVKLVPFGIFVAFFNRRSRTLHDLVAGTYVVDVSHLK